MARNRHPDKDVEKALKEIESLGWRIIVKGRGHPWAYCYAQHPMINADAANIAECRYHQHRKMLKHMLLNYSAKCGDVLNYKRMPTPKN